jgi:hypothetical protein
MRGHGIAVPTPTHDHRQPTTAEVKVAAVGNGQSFALASPSWGMPLPPGVQWHPLIGHPIVRRTWAVWSAHSRRRDLATLIDALDRAVQADQADQAADS